MVCITFNGVVDVCLRGYYVIVLCLVMLCCFGRYLLIVFVLIR